MPQSQTESTLDSLDLAEGQVARILREYAHGKVFFDPLHGNNGDQLIELGAIEAFRQAGINLISDPGQADLIIMNGGAGMTDAWRHGFATFGRYAREHSDTPLVVLPSSVQFSDPQTIAAPLRERQAPVLLFAREKHSYHRLEELDLPPLAERHLDHDMAFWLDKTELLQSLRRRKTGSLALIVERGDAEATTGQAETPVRAPFKRLFSIETKRPLKRSLHSRRARKSPLVEQAMNYARSQFGIQPSGAVVYDISRPDLASFRRFCTTIASAQIVFTTRLHVGILSTMLGRPTAIVKGLQSIGKMDGIYDYSLSNCEHTFLVEYDVEQGAVKTLQ